MDLNLSLKRLIERRKEIESERQNIYLKVGVKKPALISPYIYLSDERLINSFVEKKCHAKCCSKLNVNRRIKLNADTRKVSSDEILNDFKNKCQRGRKKRKSVLTIPSDNTSKQYDPRSRPGKRDVAKFAGGNFTDDGAKLLNGHESRSHNVTKSKLQKRTNLEKESTICKENEERTGRGKVRSRLRKVPTEKTARNKSVTLPANNTSGLYQSRNPGGERVFVFNRKVDAGDNGIKTKRSRRRRRRDVQNNAKHLTAASNSPCAGARTDVEMWRRRVCEPMQTKHTSASPARVLFRRASPDEQRSSTERPVGIDSRIETQVAVCVSRAVDCMSIASSVAENISDDVKRGHVQNLSKYTRCVRHMNRMPDKLQHISTLRSRGQFTQKDVTPTRKLEINPLETRCVPLLLTPRDRTGNSSKTTRNKLGSDTNISPSATRYRNLPLKREQSNSIAKPLKPVVEKQLQYGGITINNIVEVDESGNGCASTNTATTLAKRKSSAVSSCRKSEAKLTNSISKKSSTVGIPSPVKTGSGDSLHDHSADSELRKCDMVRRKLSRELLEESSGNEPEVISTKEQIEQKAEPSDSAKTYSIKGCGEGDAVSSPMSLENVKLPDSSPSFSKGKEKSDHFKVTTESRNIIIENRSKNYEISFELMESLSEETRTTNSSISVEISYEGLGSSESLMMATSKLALLASNTKSINGPLTEDLSSQSCSWTSKTIDTIEFSPETSIDSRGKLERNISSVNNINLDLTSFLSPDKHDLHPLLCSLCNQCSHSPMFPVQTMSDILSRSDKRNSSYGKSSNLAVRSVTNHSESAIRKKIKKMNAIRRKYDRPIQNKVIKLASLPYCTPYTNKGGNFKTTGVKILDSKLGTLHHYKLANIFSSQGFTEMIFNSLKKYEFATFPKEENELTSSAVFTKKSLFISREILNHISPVMPQMLKSYSSLNVRGNLRLALSQNKEMHSAKALEINFASDENGKLDNQMRHDTNFTRISRQKHEATVKGLIKMNQAFTTAYHTTGNRDSEIAVKTPIGIYSTPEILRKDSDLTVIEPKQKSLFKRLRRKWRERRRSLEKMSPNQLNDDRGDAKSINDVRGFMLADIKSSADFLRIIGMERDSVLLVAYEGLSAKLMTAVEELKRWTSRLTRPQALLTFVLSCRATLYPALLRDIATGELATGAELERRVEIIDEAIQIAKEEKVRENVLKSSEFYGTIVDKLCLAAGTEALNNSTSLSPEAENLFRLIAQRKLEPQIKFLRQLARYVGRGLFAS